MLVQLKFSGEAEVHVPDWYFDEEIDKYLEDFICTSVCGDMVNEYEWVEVDSNERSEEN